MWINTILLFPGLLGLWSELSSNASRPLLYETLILIKPEEVPINAQWLSDRYPAELLHEGDELVSGSAELRVAAVAKAEDSEALTGKFLSAESGAQLEEVLLHLPFESTICAQCIPRARPEDDQIGTAEVIRLRISSRENTNVDAVLDEDILDHERGFTRAPSIRTVDDCRLHREEFTCIIARVSTLRNSWLHVLSPLLPHDLAVVPRNERATRNRHDFFPALPRDEQDVVRLRVL